MIVCFRNLRSKAEVLSCKIFSPLKCFLKRLKLKLHKMGWFRSSPTNTMKILALSLIDYSLIFIKYSLANLLNLSKIK